MIGRGREAGTWFVAGTVCATINVTEARIAQAAVASEFFFAWENFLMIKFFFEILKNLKSCYSLLRILSCLSVDLICAIWQGVS
jgi:hypothetical protein